MYRKVAQLGNLTIAVEFGPLSEPFRVQLFNGEQPVGAAFTFDHTKIDGDGQEAVVNRKVLRTIYGSSRVRMPEDFEPILVIAE